VGNDGSTSTLSLTFNSAVSLQADGSGRMTILSRPPVDVTGTIDGAVPGALTGALDNGVFTASGDGYDLSGNLQDGQLTGGYDYNGSPAGGFVALAHSSGTPATQYCGEYSGQDDQTQEPESGTLNAVIAGKIIYGLVNVQQTATFDFEGSVSGTKIKVSQTIGPNNTKLVVDGDITNGGQSIDGSYTTTTPGQGSTSGTFSADAGCGGGGGGGTAWTGIYLGGLGTETGVMQYTVDPTAGTASGTLTKVLPTPGTATVAGTYDSPTDALNLANGQFTFSGNADGGNYSTTAPTAGVYYSVLTSSSPLAYCGTYHVNAPAEDGIFDVAIVGTNVVAGASRPIAGIDGFEFFAGTLNGNTFDLNTFTQVGTGTVNGTQVTGNTTFSGGENAVFTANQCN
jgi:hypothetical protein